MKKLIILTLIGLSIISCKNDDDNTCCPTPLTTKVNFNFTFNWDGTQVTQNDMRTTPYTNANGEVLTIERMRYLVSHFELINETGESFPLSGFNLVDLSHSNTFNYEANINDIENSNSIPNGTYTLKFVYGFNEEDNIDGAYPVLNSSSWNWPAMLGGGYHFMQFDGMFNVNTTAPSPFNYHNGTARISENNFEQNFIELDFQTEIHIQGQGDNPTVEIKMNLAELFKNPNTWDLNTYNTSLMPNYGAQKMMQENIASAFAIEQLD